VKRGLTLFLSGLTLLLLLAACGGEKKNDKPPAGAPQAGGNAGCAPPPSGSAAPGGRPLGGDPPGSAATARLDQIMSSAKLPADVALIQRLDLTNEEAAGASAELKQRFTDTGRVTGTQYVFSVGGLQRITLGINQYSKADGAKDEYERGRPKPRPEDALDTTGLGTAATGARIALGSGDARSFVNNVVFVRDCYLITMADFVNDANSKGEAILGTARGLDEQLRTAP